MSWYFERRRSDDRFDKRIAAAPRRNRQFERSIDRLLPGYQLRVMISMLTTSA